MITKRKTEPEPEPVEEKPVTHDPDTEIGVDTGKTGEYVYVKAPRGWQRDLTVVLDGVSLQHVADDAHGCWLYRRL